MQTGPLLPPPLCIHRLRCGLNLYGTRRFYSPGTRRFYLYSLGAECRSPNSPLLTPPRLRLGFVGLAQAYISRNILRNLTLRLKKRNFPKSTLLAREQVRRRILFRNVVLQYTLQQIPSVRNRTAISQSTDQLIDFLTAAPKKQTFPAHKEPQRWS